MDKNIYKIGNSILPHTSVHWQQSIVSSYLKSIHLEEGYL